VFEDQFGLVEDAINLGEDFFDLMESMFFLNVVEGALDVHYLQLDHMHDLF